MTQSQIQKYVKRLIKVAIRDLLKANHGGVDANNIQISRTIPTQSESLPAILIYTTTESVRRFDESPKRYERVLTVNIECMDMGDTDDDLDLRLEVIADRVETILESNETLGGIANDLELVSANYQQEPDGEAPMGSLVLQYNIEYYQFAQRLEETCLDDLKSMGIDYKVGHHADSPQPEPIETIDAKDEIEF